jgi:hypothetical protein
MKKKPKRMWKQAVAEARKEMRPSSKGREKIGEMIERINKRDKLRRIISEMSLLVEQAKQLLLP